MFSILVQSLRVEFMVRGGLGSSGSRGEGGRRQTGLNHADRLQRRESGAQRGKCTTRKNREV